MPHRLVRSLTWPAIAGASIVAATAAGIALGQSAIGEINPVHFQGAPDGQFYSDLSPNHPADWAAVTAAEYKQAAAAQPPAAAPGGCVGCMTWPAAPKPARDPEVDRALAAAWREVRAPLPAEPRVRYVETASYEAPRPDPVPERVRRYASYPVYRDEPPPPPPDWDDGDDGGDAATQ